MGLHPRQSDYARHGDASRRSNDRASTRTGIPEHTGPRPFSSIIYWLLALILGVSAVSAQSSDIVRIATFAAPLSRDGPGLLLRDIAKQEDEEIAAIIAIINHISPDILILTDFDYDAGGTALSAFSTLLEDPYPHQFALRPNAGMQTGLDIDGDGFTGDARDAMGYGRFLGDGGMALLSRHPVRVGDVTDLTYLLWRNVPDAVLPQMNGKAFPSDDVQAMLRVSSSGHWIVPIDLGAKIVTLLVFSATAPVFDGPEDFNGLRNRDELRVWEAVLDGTLAAPPIRPILIGNVNADPFDGQGIRGGIAGVLARPDLQDATPMSAGAREAENPDQSGDPALDTADWSDDGPGNLRVSYIVPARDLNVIGAGVFWPAQNDPLAVLLGNDGLAAGPHHLVWVDLEVEGVP